MQIVELITRSTIRNQQSMDIGSEVFGKASPINVRNTAIANRTVIAYDTRSPHSTGSRNTSELRNAMNNIGRTTFTM